MKAKRLTLKNHKLTPLPVDLSNSRRSTYIQSRPTSKILEQQKSREQSKHDSRHKISPIDKTRNLKTNQT